MRADYKIIHHCEFGVSCEHSSSGIADCGEPAPFLVFWENELDGFYVCQEHLDYILKIEEEQDNG